MPPSTEERITGLAARQHGLVTRTQLLEVGLSSRAVDRRVLAKRLRPIHRGVYLVGPLFVPNAREMAAVLACGPGAVLSHGSAAGLRQFLARPAASRPVEVTVSGRDRGRRPGIHAHRVARLEADEVTEFEGIPITTPGRTLLDLAGTLGVRELEQAVAQAEREQLTSRDELRKLLARHPRRRGTRSLRALLEADAGPALTRSAAEELLLELIRKAALPEPVTNAWIGRQQVDALWRRERLIVEVDGFAYHSSSSRFENDRRRDAEFAAQGYHVVRVTWLQLKNEPEAVLARLVRTLTRAELRRDGSGL